MRVLTVQSQKLFLIVKIAVYGLKIIGLAPFKLPNKCSSQITACNTRLQVFQSSKIGLVYNILFLISVLLAAVFNLIVFRKDHGKTSSMPDVVSHVIDHVEVVLRIFTACLIIMLWGIRQKNAASVMNRLLEIDLGLSSFEKQPFNMRTLIFLNIHLIINACLLAYTFYIKMIYSRSFSEYLQSILNDLPAHIIYWFIMEYSAVVGLVANDIETVNKYLLNFKEFGNYLFPPLIPNGRLAVIPAHCNSQQLASCKLNKYCDIRMRLVKLCEDIGEFFSMPILCCIACCFIPLFHSLYKLFRIAHKIRFLPAEITIEAFFIALMFAYPVVSLALNVTRIGREAQLTRKIIDKLLEETIRGEIISKLELFSRQLRHENVSFTAYGFFSLDSSFLLSMMASTVTYFLALTQFPKDDNKNCAESTSTEQLLIANRSES